MMPTIFSVIVCICIGVLDSAQASESVLLKDGSVIEGKILEEEEDVVIVKTSEGRRSINRDIVREVRRSAKSAEIEPRPAPSLVKSEAMEWQEKAELAVNRDNLKEAIKCYVEACRTDNSSDVHRRMAHACFAMAKRIQLQHMNEFQQSLEAWEKARDNATKEHRSLHEGVPKYKKVDTEDPEYKAATAKHAGNIQKITRCYPYFTQAQQSFAAVLRAARGGRDFDAAGHLPLCMTYKRDEPIAWNRGRQLLASFLKEYKPSSAIEQQIYRQCEEELERVNALSEKR